MKLSIKNFVELIITALFVLFGTAIAYSQLESLSEFWNAQLFWNVGLLVCWVVVAAGYYHQGWLISTKQSSQGVSLVLPVAVFAVQCILFVKGIYYKDIALVVGALIVNSGVTYSLYQIWSYRVTK